MNYEYGCAKEKELKPIIELVCGCPLEKFTDRYSIFDFFNLEKKILVELKSRKGKSTEYPTALIGVNKTNALDKMKCEETKAYLFFHFTDGTFYQIYDKNNKYRKDDKNMYVLVADLIPVPELKTVELAVS